MKLQPSGVLPPPGQQNGVGAKQRVGFVQHGAAPHEPESGTISPESEPGPASLRPASPRPASNPASKPPSNPASSGPASPTHTSRLQLPAEHARHGPHDTPFVERLQLEFPAGFGSEYAVPAMHASALQYDGLHVRRESPDVEHVASAYEHVYAVHDESQSTPSVPREHGMLSVPSGTPAHEPAAHAYRVHERGIVPDSSQASEKPPHVSVGVHERLLQTAPSRRSLQKDDVSISVVVLGTQTPPAPQA